MADILEQSAPTSKSPALRYKRLVVKAGTSMLTRGTNRLDQEVISGLVDQVASLHGSGAEVILVTSGAVALGRQTLGIHGERKDVPFRQVLAAVGQSNLMHLYEQQFARHNISVAQALLTWSDLSDRQRYLNVRNTLMALLELGVVPILNENDVVAVDEIGEVFGDNDRLSALVANLVDADLLAILTNTDGLFTADPNVDPDAQLIRQVDKVDAEVEAAASRHINPQTRGGMPTKLEAARLVIASGTPMVICNGWEGNVLPRLAEGEEIGTRFLPTASKLESRKRWMLAGVSPTANVVVDDGAARALTEQDRSLLPAGIDAVKGVFQRGEIISIVGNRGDRLACGITNYGSKDVDRIKGLRSDQIQSILGYHYGQEVIHRNNLVLL